MNNSNTYVCKRWRLHNYLEEHGFQSCKKVKDLYNPKFFVWLYNDSEKLQNTISAYYTECADKLK